MTWWSWIWILSLAGISIGAMKEDFEEGKSSIYALLGGLSGLICIQAVCAYFVPSVAEYLGRFLLPMVLLAALWMSFDLPENEYNEMLDEMAEDPELSETESKALVVFGTALFLILYVPAIALGILVGLRSWGLS